MTNILIKEPLNLVAFITYSRQKKLDCKWEGGWEIQSIQGPATYTITDGTRTKTVHENRLCPRTQFGESNLQAPSIEHDVIDVDGPRERCYPTRNRRPPDRFTL